jgi:predicted small metal-binding protein
VVEEESKIGMAEEVLEVIEHLFQHLEETHLQNLL